MGQLLERERELAELRAAVGQAARGEPAGSGRLVVIEARAGLGKTRLLQSSRELGAAAGWQCLGARATELEQDFPFAIVRQLLDPHVAALGADERAALVETTDDAALHALGMHDDSAPAASSGDTFTVLQGLFRLTAALAARQPLLLAIDDAHWADAASLDYLGFLIPRLEALPLRLVVAARPDEPGAAPGLARITTDASARRLEPQALSPAAATALLTAELGAQPAQAFAASCHDASGGNPFLLCELARTLVQQQISPVSEQAPLIGKLAPERVTRTVALRLARLSPAARATARALVVAGDGGDSQLVAGLARLDHPAALLAADELRAAAILDPDPSLRFIHPLVRNAVRSELPAGAQAAEHRRAAALLRARGARPEQLAAHLVASPPRGDREIVELLLAAGTRALVSGAPRSAVTYLTRALREPPPPEQRAAVLHPLITAGMRVADHSAYAAIEADLLDALERDPALLRRWAAELSTWMALNGRFDQAVELLERAIEHELHEDDPTHAFRLEALLTVIAQIPLAEARARLQPFCARFEPGSPGRRFAAALEAQWCTYLGGTAAEAVRWAREALDGTTVLIETMGFMAPTRALTALLFADELHETKQILETAMGLARARGSTSDLVGAWTGRAAAAQRLGELATAESDLRQTIEIARHGGLTMALPLLGALLMDTLVERGALDAAERELEEFHAGGSLPDIVWIAPLLFARGRLRLAQGRAEPAAEDFARVALLQERAGSGDNPATALPAYAARAARARRPAARPRAGRAGACRCAALGCAERDLACVAGAGAGGRGRGGDRAAGGGGRGLGGLAGTAGAGACAERAGRGAATRQPPC